MKKKPKSSSKTIDEGVIEESQPEKSHGKDVASFSSFRLDPRLLKAITNQFEKPTLVQAAAIPLALKGRDIVARAKTGSGKTAAYVIPIIHQILTKSVMAPHPINIGLVTDGW